MSDELFAALRQSVIDGDAVQSAALAQQALDDGVPPLDAIEIGLVPGLSYVGEQFGEGELFLPDMMLAARAMQKAMDILEPELQAQSAQRKIAGRVVIGTVKGDIHEIGKNLVGMMLSTSGFEVHDLGVDVAPDRFVEAAKEHDADIVGVSALLTTTMAGQRTVVEALVTAGLRRAGPGHRGRRARQRELGEGDRRGRLQRGRDRRGCPGPQAHGRRGGGLRLITHPRRTSPAALGTGSRALSRRSARWPGRHHPAGGTHEHHSAAAPTAATGRVSRSCRRPPSAASTPRPSTSSSASASASRPNGPRRSGPSTAPPSTGRPASSRRRAT